MAFSSCGLSLKNLTLNQVTCGQYYKQFMLVIYDSRVVFTSNLLIFFLKWAFSNKHYNFYNNNM